MAITLVTDPIMALEDAQELLQVTTAKETSLLINALTEKFKAFTGRTQLSGGYTTQVTERLRGNHGTSRLWLHGAPVHLVDGDSNDLALEATVYVDGAADEEYTYADGELQLVYNDDQSAAIELIDERWPCRDSQSFVEVVYYGGWLAIPGDVIQGAVMQGRVDLRRSEGVVGMSEASANGESTKYDTRSIIKPVRELWTPYKVL